MLVDPWWALPFVATAILVDWARVGAGIHHLVDVVGSSIIVAGATLVAVVVASLVIPRLALYLPAGWKDQRLLRIDRH